MLTFIKVREIVTTRTPTTSAQGKVIDQVEEEAMKVQDLLTDEMTAETFAEKKSILIFPPQVHEQVDPEAVHRVVTGGDLEVLQVEEEMTYILAESGHHLEDILPDVMSD